MLPSLIALSLLVSAPSATANPPSPKPWLQSLVDKGTALANRDVKVGTPEETKWNAEIKTLIDETLDWNEITQRSLGKHWEKLKPKQRTEFAALLREMIEASYRSKIRMAMNNSSEKKRADLVVEWTSEEVTGATARSIGKFKVGQSFATLGFDLNWSNGHWRVSDVVVDEVSTVRTYRSQFNKIISKDGFEKLLERLRSKTAAIREGKADIAPTKAE